MLPYRKILFPLLIFVLASCATSYTLVNPGRLDIGAFYTVEPDNSWSRIVRGKMELWTVDGPSLEALRFISGLEDGDRLLPVLSRDIKMPHFKAHMTPSEVLEFCVGSLESMGAARVAANHLRPENFGKHPGFRFDVRFFSEEGLERQGLIVGTIHEEKLYLIIFTAPRVHYYPQYKEQVERIVASIETLQ
jgi:hypothetical protein